MQLNIISTFESTIDSVQLKLTDYISSPPSFTDGIVTTFLPKKRNINTIPELILHVDNHFEIHNPHCPTCDSTKVIKQEYYQRNLKLAELGRQKIYVRRYLCKSCGKKFTTPLNSIVEKGHQYAKIYQKRVQESYKTGYCSLRHLKKIFKSIYDHSPSHQTIYDWIKDTRSKSTNSDKSNRSGYYCYDEQYLKIDGNRFYRLSMYDSIIDKIVLEEIVDNLEYNTVKLFIKKAVADDVVHAISTDHRRKYKRIMDELKIDHQLCIFHLFKLIGKNVYKKIKSKFIGDKEKIKICMVFTQIKEIFRTYDDNIALSRLESLLEYADDIPVIFHKAINKIVEDFDRITLFMRDGMVSRTTNPIENYYRQTMPSSIKRIFKTPEGVLNFLDKRGEYWVENISKNV